MRLLRSILTEMKEDEALHAYDLDAGYPAGASGPGRFRKEPRARRFAVSPAGGSVAFHCSAKKANNVFPSQKSRFLPISPNCPQRPSGREVRQQVFGTLGRLDELKASGRLEALIRSELRHCEKFAVIDAHAAGETRS